MENLMSKKRKTLKNSLSLGCSLVISSVCRETLVCFFMLPGVLQGMSGWLGKNLLRVSVC